MMRAPARGEVRRVPSSTSLGRQIRSDLGSDFRCVYFVADSCAHEIRFLGKRLRRTVAWAIEVRHECASHHEAVKVGRGRCVDASLGQLLVVDRIPTPRCLRLLPFPAVDLEQSVMIVVTQAAEVIQLIHLEVGARQCSREPLSNSHQNARTRFLLDPDRKRELSALFSLLRRDFVVRELAMGLALFVCANVNDCARFAAVYDDCNLRMRTLPVTFRTAILTLVERVWSSAEDLPGRALRNLNGLLPFFCQGANPQLNERLDLRLMASRIGAQGAVLDLREE